MNKIKNETINTIEHWPIKLVEKLPTKLKTMTKIKVGNLQN